MRNQTRNALREMGGPDYELGSGPLAKIAERLVTEWQANEEARMDAAWQRAAEQGSAPYLDVLQRKAREISAQSLLNNAAPAITTADFHDLLSQANEAYEGKDRGLARAATHAYRLFTKDTQGHLTVGDLARFRTHYSGEYPRSKIASVIDHEVPKVGFNTLPLNKLSRIASDISRKADQHGDLQGEYEFQMERHGFAQNTPECIRARAFVRSLLESTTEQEDAPADIASRVAHRLATDTDPVLGQLRRTAMQITLSQNDGDDGFVTVYADPEEAMEDGSIMGSNWEAPGDMGMAYAMIMDQPGLVEALEAQGYEVDDSEYFPMEAGKCAQLDPADDLIGFIYNDPELHAKMQELVEAQADEVQYKHFFEEAAEVAEMELTQDTLEELMQDSKFYAEKHAQMDSGMVDLSALSDSVRSMLANIGLGPGSALAHVARRSMVPMATLSKAMSDLKSLMQSRPDENLGEAAQALQELLANPKMAQLELEEEPMDMSPEEEPGMGDTEYSEIESPITGEPMMLELETAEQAADEGEILPEEADSLQVMGQLSDFADEAVSMDPMPDEVVTVIEDPTDPDGGELEVTMKPIEPMPEPEPEPEMEMEGAHGESSERECPETKEANFAVYAYMDHKRASEPLERLNAPGMAAVLRHIAASGVQGEVRSTPQALANDALIVLDAERGDYLQVVAEASAECEKAFNPKINEQQDDYMPDVSKDGGEALKSESMGKQRNPKKALSEIDVQKRCASLKLDATTIEDRVLSGEIVKVAGWSLSVNDDADVELRFEDGTPRTASLSDFDGLVKTFQRHAASNYQEPAPKHYELTELFSVRCAGCESIYVYPMPDEAVDIDCPDCSRTAKAAAIAETFETGNPVVGYVLVTDLPESDEPSYMAKRVLAALRKVVPDARGMLRKDAKLEVEFDGADNAAMNRIRKVLEGRYGIKEFEVQAQAIQQPAMDQQGQPANTQQQAPNAPNAPTAPGMQPAQPQQPVQPQQAYQIDYEDEDGEQGSHQVSAKSAEKAQALFEHFNDGVRVIRVAQLEPEPELEPAPEPEPEPADDLAGMMPPPPMPEQMDSQPSTLAPDQSDAIRAALTHYRNQGLGPMSALDQLNSQYRDLVEQFGEKTEHTRHLIEAEAMKLAAEVWMKPAVMSAQAAIDAPKVNTQQPDYVNVDRDLGEDSETDDSVTNSLEAPKINTQVAPKGKMSDTDLGPDSEAKDPGDFGAGKPKQQHPATDQKGVSLSDTDLGADSSTGENKTTQRWDNVSKDAPANSRSK